MAAEKQDDLEALDTNEPLVLYCMRGDWKEIAKELVRWSALGGVMLLLALIATIMGASVNVLGMLYGICVIALVCSVAFVVGRNWRWDKP